MHFHSRYSDGSLWPAELAAAARASGLEAAALTDHDTLAGVPDFLAAARAAGLRAWAGVEIDCHDGATGYRSELLAYFPGGRYEATESLLGGIRSERRRIVAELFRGAARYFSRTDLSFERYEQEELDSRPKETRDAHPNDIRYGKPDLYRALMQKGIIPPRIDYRQFKKAYLSTGLFGLSRFPKPSVEETCATVLADGGFLSLPHVGHVFDDDYKAMKKNSALLMILLERFKSFGLGYVELYAYGGKREADMNTLVEEAARLLGLGLSYGSDDHGPGSGKAAIGSFYGQFDGFPSPGSPERHDNGAMHGKGG